MKISWGLLTNNQLLQKCEQLSDIEIMECHLINDISIIIAKYIVYANGFSY